MLDLRIHHIFDIIRDLGENKEIKEHEYGHSYHIIAKDIYSKPERFKLIVSNDDICKNCNKLVNGNCIDKIDHRHDYTSKEQFNNYLDERIMTVMGFEEGQILTIFDLLKMSELYMSKIEHIYAGNDIEHTANRKLNVQKGIEVLKTKFQN